jgi:hypothetical protein
VREIAMSYIDSYIGADVLGICSPALQNAESGVLRALGRRYFLRSTRDLVPIYGSALPRIQPTAIRIPLPMKLCR